MVGVFKQKAPGNIALLALFALLLKLPLFLHPAVVLTSPADGKGFQLLAIWLHNAKFSYWPSVLALVLLYVQALMLTQFVNEYRMTSRATFLPGMAYILFTSLLPEWSYLSAPLVSATFVIWAFITLFQLYNAPAANRSVYNIGLYLGLASFFYFPSALFVVCIYIGLAVLRPFRLNEALLLLVGITTPYYFYALYLFLTDKFSLQLLIPDVAVHLPADTKSIWLGGAVLLFTLPFLMGGYYIQTHLRKMVIQARKNWSVCLFWALIALLIPFINTTDSFQNWVLAAAPFAVFSAAAYLYPPKSWVAQLLFFAAVIFILGQQFGAEVWR